MTWLLNHGANIEAQGGRRKETPLHIAAWEARRHAVLFLIARGASVTARTSDGATPLHLAASVGSAAVCETLLRALANPHARDHAGHTPLEVAVGDAYVYLL